MYEVQSDVSLNARLDSLTRKVDALVLSQTMKAKSQVQHDACNACASPIHYAMVCPLGHQEGISEQVNAINQFNIILIGRIIPTFLGDPQPRPNQVGPPGFNQFHPP